MLGIILQAGRVGSLDTKINIAYNTGMTTHIMPRFGFACKWINDPSEVGGMKVNAKDRELNGRSTTMRWLREHKAEAEQRQWDIMNHNASAALRLVERVGSLEPHLRMVRLGSEMLQGYTEKDWQAWWQRPEIQDHCERIFAPVGEAARRLGVRLSFHPGQFCVLASESDVIVERSIEEFEYHADMARWMGYGRTFQDFKINIHIQPGDDRVRRVIDSWRGVRPTLHYSVSREDYLVDHAADIRPDYQALLATGRKKQKLRAHSDFFWNRATNAWAAEFSRDFDIMCEAKGKNLASFEFAEQARQP